MVVYESPLRGQHWRRASSSNSQTYKLNQNFVCSGFQETELLFTTDTPRKPNAKIKYRAGMTGLLRMAIIINRSMGFLSYLTRSCCENGGPALRVPETVRYLLFI